MRLRALLVGLIAVATIGFVVGVAIERNSRDTHKEPAAQADAAAEGGEAQESPEQRLAERATRTAGGTSHDETAEELKPLGVDVDAAPFVALAALASLGLAFAASRRPRSVPLLIIVAAAMLAFAVLDIREVFHQDDEGRTGVAILAGSVAVLHLGAAMIAGFMAHEAAITIRQGPREGGSPEPGRTVTPRELRGKSRAEATSRLRRRRRRISFPPQHRTGRSTHGRCGDPTLPRAGNRK